jgi:hypothetical protein
MSFAGLIFFFFKIKNIPVSDEAPPAFIDYVPNFDNLLPSDLPNFTDYRKIHPYNNHLLVAGYNRIVEYDPGSQQIVRMNNPKSLNCINWTALIDNNLYISCYKHQKLPYNSSLQYSILYKVDLSSNKIIKTYFDVIPATPSNFNLQTDLEPESSFYSGRKINLFLAVQGATLWMSSYDGVMRMDTSNDQIISYPKQEVITGLCNPGGIFNDEGTIIITSTCHDFLSSFNNRNNTWTITPLNPEEYISKEKTFYPDKENPPIQFPIYNSISPLFKDRYYILANDGLYSLDRGKFPAKIIDESILLGSTFKTYYSEDKKYILFIGSIAKGPEETGITLIKNLMRAYLVDLQNLSITDLMKPDEFNKEATPIIEQRISQLGGSSYEEKNGLISFKDNSNDELIISVDLSKARLKINK